MSIMHRNPVPGSNSNESGFVLITGLVLLAITMIMVVAAMRTTLFEELMSRGASAQLGAFQAAEAASRQVETDIFKPVAGASAPIDQPFNPNGFTAECTSGYCKQNLGENGGGGMPSWESVNWNSTSNTKTSSLTISGISNLRYVIECLGGCSSDTNTGSGCAPVYFRVTSRASPTLGGKVLVQSIYAFKPSDCSKVYSVS